VNISNKTFHEISIFDCKNPMQMTIFTWSLFLC